MITLAEGNAESKALEGVGEGKRLIAIGDGEASKIAAIGEATAQAYNKQQGLSVKRRSSRSRLWS